MDLKFPNPKFHLLFLIGIYFDVNKNPLELRVNEATVEQRKLAE